MTRTGSSKKRSFLKAFVIGMLFMMLAVAGSGSIGFAAESTDDAGPAAAAGGIAQTTAAGPAAAAPVPEQSEPAKTPSLSAKKLKITSSGKKKLVLKDCTERPVWKSSNKKVALVGKTSDPCKVWIKGRKAGKATITAKVGSKKYSCKVTVRYRPKLSRTKKTLKGEKAFILKVSGTIDKAEWRSSDPDIASVNRKTGKKVTVSGKRNGKVTIYAKVNGRTLSCAVRVKGITPTENCIMGSQKTGYYYVDGTGSRVYDDQIVMALNFLNSVSSPSQTPRARMLACFRKLCTYTYSWHPDSPSAWVMPTYAADTFRTKIANCWRFGAAFAYIARVLGYDTRVCIGGVTAYQYSELSNHGWCEIYIDGTWKMVDVSMQKHHPEVSLFLVPRYEYPFRLRCDSIYTMRITNGRVYWS